MLVPRERLEAAEAIAAAVAEAYTPGDPLVDGSAIGPLVSDVQRDRVRGYIEKGEQEGAKLVTGGAEAPEGLEQGYFVRPTVFSQVTTDMTIAQEEIFGPVLAIMPYEDEEDAVRNTGCPAECGRPTRSAQRRWRRASVRGRWRSTAAAGTRWRRSAATSSRGTGARPGSTASRSTS